MSSLDAGLSWPGEVQLVLDTYLRKIGIVTAEVRARWVAHVVSGLQLSIGDIAVDDIVEQAVEHLRDAMEARVARIAHLDPLRDGREIAGILVVLQDEKHAALVNTVFADCDDEIAPLVSELLRGAAAADRPRPVPEDAPLDLPTQAIQLRSMNPLRWLFGDSR